MATHSTMAEELAKNGLDTLDHENLTMEQRLQELSLVARYLSSALKFSCEKMNRLQKQELSNGASQIPE